MDIRYKDDALRRLAEEEDAGGYPPGVAKAYRKRIQTMKGATDERVLRNWKSLHFEKYEDGHSIRVNKQWRVLLELQGEAPSKAILILALTDYH